MVGSALLTKTTVLLTAKKSDEESKQFSFQPGQYAAISYKNRWRPTATRCFSIASSPTDQSILQFGIRIKGGFTKGLLKLQPGDELNVRGPFGGFVLNTARDKEAVLLAGGIGISPFIGMIRFATDAQQPNPITLLYSCHSQDDVPFLPEIQRLEHANHNFKAAFAIGTGPTQNIQHPNVHAGRLTPELLDNHTSGIYTDKTFFICGPTPFMNGMVALLRSKGTPESNIMTEAFGQGSSRQTGKIRSWPFNIYALGAAGLAAGSFAVMVGDLIKTLPPKAVLDSNNTARKNVLTNDRQADLDALVNQLPTTESSMPATNAVNEALQQVAAGQTQTTQPTAAAPTPSKTTNPTATPSTSTPTVTPSPTPTPVPTPTPTPAPKPVCITSQSGAVCQ